MNSIFVTYLFYGAPAGVVCERKNEEDNTPRWRHTEFVVGGYRGWMLRAQKQVLQFCLCTTKCGKIDTSVDAKYDLGTHEYATYSKENFVGCYSSACLFCWHWRPRNFHRSLNFADVSIHKGRLH